MTVQIRGLPFDTIPIPQSKCILILLNFKYIVLIRNPGRRLPTDIIQFPIYSTRCSCFAFQLDGHFKVDRKLTRNNYSTALILSSSTDIVTFQFNSATIALNFTDCSIFYSWPSELQNILENYEIRDQKESTAQFRGQSTVIFPVPPLNSISFIGPLKIRFDSNEG